MQYTVGSELYGNPSLGIPNTGLLYHSLQGYTGDVLGASTVSPLSYKDQFTRNWSDLSFGGKTNAVLGTVGSFLDAYNAFQTHRLAKQNLAFKQDMFNKQYNAQRNLTNSRLEDRQRRRNEENARTTSVDEYMRKYGV